MSVDIARMTAHLTPAQQEEIARAYRRTSENATTAFLLCFFLGIFGAHRFYLRQWGSALLHLVLAIIAAGLLVYVVLQQPALAVATTLISIAAVLLFIDLVWEIVDLFRIDGQIHRHNLKIAEGLIGAVAIEDPTVVRQAMEKLDSMVTQAEQRADTAAASEEAATERVADAESATGTPEVFAAGSGVITRDDVEHARELAEDASAVSTGHFVSTTETTISGDPDAAPETPVTTSASESDTHQRIIGTGETASEDAVEDVPGIGEDVLGAAAVVGGVAAVEGISSRETTTESHSETSYSHTDSVEVDDTVAAADVSEEQVAEADEVESVAAPFPEMVPVVTDEYGPTDRFVPVVLDEDQTDRHPHVHHIKPVADLDVAPREPVYVDVPDYLPERTPEPPVEVAAPAPPVPSDDEGIAALGWGLESADQPPAEAFVPPVVPLTAEPFEVVEPPAEMAVAEEVPNAVVIETESVEAQTSTGETLAELAGFVGVAGAAGVAATEFAAEQVTPAAEPAEQPTPEAPAAETPAFDAVATPTAEAAASEPVEEAPRKMKRVRVVRKIVVDGQVVDEQVVEELVPVDTDTSQTAQAMQDSLGHKSPEEIAQMAHLTDSEIEVRRRIESQPRPDGTTEV